MCILKDEFIKRSVELLGVDIVVMDNNPNLYNMFLKGDNTPMFESGTKDEVKSNLLSILNFVYNIKSLSMFNPKLEYTEEIGIEVVTLLAMVTSKDGLDTLGCCDILNPNKISYKDGLDTMMCHAILNPNKVVSKDGAKMRYISDIDVEVSKLLRGEI